MYHILGKVHIFKPSDPRPHEFNWVYYPAEIYCNHATYHQGTTNYDMKQRCTYFIVFPCLLQVIDRGKFVLV